MTGECQSVSQSVSAIAALRGAAECTYEIGAFWAEIDRAAFCGDLLRWIGYGTLSNKQFGALVARMR